MMETNIIVTQEQRFAEIVGIIQKNRCAASRAVNEATLLTAWQVGGYVSHKLKSEEWGSKVVTQLSEFIRSHYPDIKGYSRSSIYNMVIMMNTLLLLLKKIYAMSRSMSPTMLAEYKRILMPQDQMQKMLNEYCSYYLEDGKKVEKESRSHRP